MVSVIVRVVVVASFKLSPYASVVVVVVVVLMMDSCMPRCYFKFVKCIVIVSFLFCCVFSVGIISGRERVSELPITTKLPPRGPPTDSSWHNTVPFILRSLNEKLPFVQADILYDSYYTTIAIQK